VRDALVHEFAGFERKLRAIARQDDNALRLMTTPGVGVLVALTFVAAVDAPERFRSSRAVGPHFGLTPKKYQSGETDHSGRISKIGDGSVRTALYEAANVILTRPVRSSDLKGWALAVARRAGPRKGRVALARKLAVVLHCMLRDRTNFIPHKGAPALAALIGGDDKTGFRTGTAISPPQQGPFAGTMDGLGRYAISSTR
jgi:transposase